MQPAIVGQARRGVNPAVSLFRSGSTVAAMTLLSRVLGFVRDQVLAVTFGASGTMDVFLVAFKIPNFLRRLFGEGAFAQAFVPVFTEYRETRSPAALRELAAHVSGTFALVPAGGEHPRGGLRAPADVAVRAGLRRRARALRAGRADAPDHVPVPLLRVARGLRGQAS